VLVTAKQTQSRAGQLRDECGTVAFTQINQEKSLFLKFYHVGASILGMHVRCNGCSFSGLGWVKKVLDK
jgi:hypothetical protein